jgi:hypothetical protein
MSRARNLADLLDASGDVVSGALDNVPPSNDASALTTGTLPVERVPYVGRKNLIINGDMRIDQRNAGASHTGSGFVYSTDRWWTYYDSSFGGTITRQQSTDAPDGFTHSLKWTVGTADTSITSAEQYIINQSIEAQNMSQLGLGTSWAKDSTLSFWVKSSATGQYGVMVGSSSNTLYTTTVTVNAADTWEYKTVTIPGTSTGSWGTGNSTGLYVRITLAAGTNYQTNFGTWSVGTYKLTNSSQVNWMATSGNTFYLTGVQLEVGSVATPFEHRSYGEELALCQRYLPAWNGVQPISNAFFFSTTSVGTNITFPVPTRVPPSGIIVSNATHFRFDTVSPYAISSLSFYDAGTKTALITGVVSGAPLNAAGRFLATNSSSQLLFTGCEL